MSDYLGLFNYGASLFLFLFGLYIIMTENNLLRKVIGMTILQSAIILFYISLSYKIDAVLPIVEGYGYKDIVDPSHYANPLPHALMLTAIVVGVATLGVALVLLVSIYRSHKTLEEDQILENISS